MDWGIRPRVLFILWYSRDDFEVLLQTDRGRRLPPSYDRWLEQANEALLVALETGQAVRIVHVDAHDYFTWVADEGRMESSITRLRYIARLASGARILGLPHEKPTTRFLTDR